MPKGRTLTPRRIPVTRCFDTWVFLRFRESGGGRGGRHPAAQSVRFDLQAYGCCSLMNARQRGTRSVIGSPERLEPRQLLAVVTMSAQEQLLLELMNRARADPAAEAARFDIDLNEGLDPGTIATTPQQPLAPHQILIDAAGLHAQDMLDRDFFEHVDPDGLDPSDRAAALGYPASVGENIAWRGTTGTLDVDRSVVDLHEGLFRSSGHRDNLLTPAYREAGPGIRGGDYTDEGTTYNAVMVVEKLGRTSAVYLTGVAFTDAVMADDFYTIGEAIPDITVTATSTTGTTFTTVTGPSGGYALPLAPGTYTVAFADTAAATTVTIAGANVKLDLDADGTSAPPPVEPPAPLPTEPPVEPLGVDAIAVVEPRAYRAGETIVFTVSLSEPVEVVGRPLLPLVIGRVTRRAAYSDGAGTDTLTFSYRIGRRDHATAVAVGAAFTFPRRAGIVAGSGWLSASLAHIDRSLTGVTFDTRAPRAVGTVVAPAAGTYGPGAALDFTVRFSEVVTVEGLPTIRLGGLAGGRQATYLGGAGTTEITFRYVVQPGDVLPGRRVLTLARRLAWATGAMVGDAAGNAAVPRISVPRLRGIRIDPGAA
jgi:hypothetical protein